MAMEASEFIIGIDVAKAELVVHFQSHGTQMSVSNTKPEIKKWLKQQPANTALCVEATNVYHLDVVEMAHEKGFKVYVVDGFQLSNYRKSIGGRSKTDSSDAPGRHRQPFMASSRAFCAAGRLWSQCAPP